MLKKKGKKILSCITILVLIMLMHTNVKAVITSGEYDANNDKNISLPFMIMDGEGTILVSGVENYTLYYQGVQIDESLYTDIINANNQAKIDFAAEKADLDSEGAELTAESAELDDMYANLDTGDQAAIDDYNAKVNDYNAKKDDYNAKVDSYNTNLQDKQLELINMYPSFNANNWTLTKDGNFTLSTEFQGKKEYVVWAKLVKSDSTVVYNAELYTVNGTEQEDTTPPADTTKTLTGISVTKQPTKTTYKTGDKFSTAGMVVTATYSDGSTAAVTNYTYTPTGALKSGDKVIISYTEGNITKTAAVSIVIATNTTNTTNTNSTTKDNTTVKGTLPYTGTGVLTGLFAIVTAGGVIGYIRYRQIRIK